LSTPSSTYNMKMNTISRQCILAFLLCLLLALVCQASDLKENDQFIAGITQLSSTSFDDKKEAIKSIGLSGSEHAETTLQALLAGDLYFIKSDKKLVIGEKQGSKYAITDFLTREDLGLIKKRKLKKVTINNQLRGSLKATLAQLNLKHPDKHLRLAAAKSILNNLTPELLPVLKERQQEEQDEDVREVLGTALGVAGLKHPEMEKRLEAVQAVQNNLNPVVKNELITLLETEKDPTIVAQVKAALAQIEIRLAWYAKLETIFFGLSLGSVLVLAAIGLAITFGVIGVINMAHGELIMLGAYTTYVIQQLMPHSIGLALAISVPAAFCVSGLVGIVIERSVIRFLYGRPLETLLATFGISLVLQQTVRSIFSPLNRSVSTPEWMSGSIVINPVLSLTTNRVTIFIFAMIVFAGLYLLLKKSSLGLHVRAVAQNRSMARAMGVRAARVDALTFGLGSGIAGVAGVALSQLTNVGPNLGQAYIIDSFMVVVFGGVGNLWGTLLGGLSLGIANKFLEPWSGAVLAKILILVFIILFIQKRPQGLFPQKGRAAE
jgi:urea transport system permease protein